MGLAGVDWAGAGVDASGRLQPVWLKALGGRGPAGIRGTGRPAAPPPAEWRQCDPWGLTQAQSPAPQVSQETPAPGEGPCALGSSQGELSRPHLPGRAREDLSPRTSLAAGQAQRSFSLPCHLTSLVKVTWLL